MCPVYVYCLAGSVVMQQLLCVLVMNCTACGNLAKVGYCMTCNWRCDAFICAVFVCLSNVYCIAFQLWISRHTLQFSWLSRFSVVM